MKKRIILFTAILGVAYVSLSSYEAGPGHTMGGNNFTGGPGSAGTCANAGCHTGTSVTPATSIAIELRKLSTGSTGPIVNGYNPDTTYIVTLRGTNTTATLVRFGFQFMALTAVTNVDAGTFSNFPANVGPASVAGKMIVEHTLALNPTSGEYLVSFNWKAPAAGTAAVKLYGIINAVNNDNYASSLDKPSAPLTITLNEVAPTAVAAINADMNINAYPNPVTYKLNIDISNADNGTYAINVYDMAGRIITTQKATVNKSLSTTINTSAWNAGMYYVQLSKDGAKKTIAVVK